MLRAMCRLYVVLWICVSLLLVYSHLSEQVHSLFKQAFQAEQLLEEGEEIGDFRAWTFFLPRDESMAVRRFLMIALFGSPIALWWIVRRGQKERDERTPRFKKTRIGIVAVANVWLMLSLVALFSHLWSLGQRRIDTLLQETATFDKEYEQRESELEIQLPADLPTPDIATSDMAGGSWNPASQAGRVVLLDFWASWCAPCIESMDTIKQIYAARADDARFEIVTVCLDRERSVAEEQAKKLAVPGRLLFEEGAAFDNALALAYRVREIPHTELIGPDGKSYFVNLGDRNLPRMIDTLLDQTEPKAGDD